MILKDISWSTVETFYVTTKMVVSRIITQPLNTRLSFCVVHLLIEIMYAPLKFYLKPLMTFCVTEKSNIVTNYLATRY